MSAVRLEHVTKVFGETVAVDDASFAAQPKEFLTMLGPSGCGKTTALRMVAGFIRPTKGDIYIKDERVTDKPTHKRRTGMVFQNYALFPHMAVFENLAYGLKLKGIDSGTIKAKVAEVLELIRLPGYEGRYPRELSGGQQQRVALARAIIVEPDVLLLDEPLSNLDYKLRIAMRSEVKKIQRDTGITTIFVTHDQGEALTMSDRVVIFNKGKVMQIGKPTEVYERPGNKFVADFIGEANFFEGTILEIRGSEALISIDNLIFLHTTCAPQMEEMHEEKAKVSLSVRPERIRLMPPTSEHLNKKNAFQGEVEDLHYMGSTVRYQLCLGDRLRVKVDDRNLGGRLYSPKEKVCIEIKPEDCFILPKEAS